jgi:hypothetical protein
VAAPDSALCIDTVEAMTKRNKLSLAHFTRRDLRVCKKSDKVAVDVTIVLIGLFTLPQTSGRLRHKNNVTRSRLRLIVNVDYGSVSELY